MSDFGDFENDDALDTEPADAEQVARKLHRIRREYDGDLPEWDSLTDGERMIAIAIMVRILAWLRRQGAL